jgi:hypothetical protein
LFQPAVKFHVPSVTHELPLCCWFTTLRPTS